MNKILVLVSDKNYLQHVKYLFTNIINEGKWDGDLCLIFNGDESENLEEFLNYGIIVIKKKIENPYYAKLYLFSDYFKNWDYLMYMDCDFVIFDSLSNIPLPNNEILMDQEPFYIHQYFCQGEDENIRQYKLNELRGKNLNIDTLGFNSGFMFLDTKLITQNTQSELFDLKEQLQKYNNHTNPNGGDQPILNLYFLENIKKIENNLVCYIGAINHQTIATHTCRWGAPWSSGKFSENLGMTYIDFYNKSLNNFSKTFSKIQSSGN